MCLDCCINSQLCVLWHNAMPGSVRNMQHVFIGNFMRSAMKCIGGFPGSGAGTRYTYNFITGQGLAIYLQSCGIIAATHDGDKHFFIYEYGICIGLIGRCIYSVNPIGIAPGTISVGKIVCNSFDGSILSMAGWHTANQNLIRSQEFFPQQSMWSIYVLLGSCTTR